MEKKNTNIIDFAVIDARKRYRALDIFDQVRMHNTFVWICSVHDIDMFLLTCTDEHFQDLLDKQLTTEASAV